MENINEELVVGVSPWIIEDGNFPHFSTGDEASFALEFYAAVPLVVTAAGSRPSLQRISGSYYALTAPIVNVLESEGWWVINPGTPMYQKGRVPEGGQEGAWVTGNVYVGVDPFFYVERLSRYYAAPPLIFDWRVRKIEGDCTPLIQIDNGGVILDLEKASFAEVESTRSSASHHVMTCSRLTESPRR